MLGKSTYLDFIRTGYNKVLDFGGIERVQVSPQLTLAAFRFLSSCMYFLWFKRFIFIYIVLFFVLAVEPFQPEFISEEVLKALMAKDIYFEAKGEPRLPDIKDMSPENVLYVRDKPADYFIMILEGHARIIVTKENQEYTTGPFCCFGVKALDAKSYSQKCQQNGNCFSIPMDIHFHCFYCR